MKFENNVIKNKETFYGEIKSKENFCIDDDVVVTLDTTPQNVELEAESKNIPEL